VKAIGQERQILHTMFVGGGGGGAFRKIATLNTEKDMEVYRS